MSRFLLILLLLVFLLPAPRTQASDADHAHAACLLSAFGTTTGNVTVYHLDHVTLVSRSRDGIHKRVTVRYNGKLVARWLRNESTYSLREVKFIPGAWQDTLREAYPTCLS